MARVDARPFPPASYGVVVVGSGPGGLQVASALSELRVDHAVLSADEAPGGMFRRFPVYERLISWTKPDAPFPRGTREYELYDHNSLVADDEEAQACCPALMDRSYDVPSRAEMEASLAAFAGRRGIAIRYGCRWEATRQEEDGLVLETTDGEYRCRAAVFALGVTVPWRPEIPGLDDVPHYVDVDRPQAYQGKSVFIVGKRNSGFEVASGLLPWAREIVLASPRPVRTDVLARSPLRTRYLQPYDEYVRGRYGTAVLDAAIERVERTGDGYRVVTSGTTHPGERIFEADEVIAATGFRTPLGDLTRLGATTVADGRIPAQTVDFESVGVPRVYFAGNATQGSPGLRKEGLSANSTSVNGFRYNARALARHLAERHFGAASPQPPVPPEAVVSYLLAELARAPELWIQKGYLCRVLELGRAGPRDLGILPLQVFVDAAGPDAVAVDVEMAGDGAIYPAVYVRRGNRLDEHRLPPDPAYAFDGEPYRRALSALVGPLLRSA